MAKYTKEEILAAAQRAEQAGDTAKAARLRELAGRAGGETPARPERRKKVALLSSGLARSLAQGIMLGASDEVEAYLRSKFGGEDYDQALKEVRGNLAQYRQDRPGAALAAEIGGGFLIPGLGTAAGVTKGGLVAARGLGGVAARGAAAGVGAGGVAGFAAGEGGFEERLKTAGTGAALGGVIGGAAPVAGAVAGDVVTGIADNLGLSGQRRAAQLAERRVLKALEREGLTPETAGERLQAARELGAEILPADLGEATRGAAYTAQAVPSDRRTAVRGLLEERGIEQGGRIADRTAESMDATGSYGLDYLDEIAAAAKEKYRPLYQAADKPIDAEPFREFADRAIFKQAYRRAQRAADDLGEGPLPPLDELLDADTVSTMHLQQIAQGLDEIIEGGTDPITGKMTAEAQRVKRVRDQFKGQIGDLNPDYRAADAEFRDMMDLRRAYDVGEGFERMSDQMLERKLSAMTAEEIEAMKTGMITKIREIGSGSDRTDYFQRIFGSPKRREALRRAMGDEEFARFSDYMALERDMVRTSRRVLGGSDTARNLLEQGEQGIDPAGLLQLVMGGKGEAVRQLSGAMLTRAQGVGAPTAAQMSDILFASGPQAQSEALSRLMQRQMLEQARRRSVLAQPEFYGAGAGAAMGTQQPR